MNGQFKWNKKRTKKSACVTLAFYLLIQAFNGLAAKKPPGKVNNENEVPEHIQTAAIKADTKVPVDQFKAFCVYEEDQITDENVQPKIETTKDESMVSVSAINISMNTSNRLVKKKTRFYWGSFFGLSLDKTQCILSTE